MHSWTIDDDVVTLYLYMYGDSKIVFSIKEIGEKLGMEVNNLRARIGNSMQLRSGRLFSPR